MGPYRLAHTQQSAPLLRALFSPRAAAGRCFDRLVKTENASQADYVTLQSFASKAPSRQKYALEILHLILGSHLPVPVMGIISIIIFLLHINDLGHNGVNFILHFRKSTFSQYILVLFFIVHYCGLILATINCCPKLPHRKAQFLIAKFLMKSH